MFASRPEGIRDGNDNERWTHAQQHNNGETDDKQTYGKVEGARATKQITMACNMHWQPTNLGHLAEIGFLAILTLTQRILQRAQQS